MRSTLWVVSLTLVASAVTTVAVVDYAQRHPESHPGQLLARVRGTATPTPAPKLPATPTAMVTMDGDAGAKAGEVPPMIQELQVVAAATPLPKDEPKQTTGANFAEEYRPGMLQMKGSWRTCLLCRTALWLRELALANCCEALAQIAALNRFLGEQEVVWVLAEQQRRPRTIMEIVVQKEERESAAPTGCLEAGFYIRLQPRTETATATPTIVEEEEICLPATVPACGRCGCCREACGMRVDDRPIPHAPEDFVPATAIDEPEQMLATPTVIAIPVPVAVPVPVPAPIYMQTRFYTVDDLLTGSQSVTDLVDILKAVVLPESWKSNGGEADITYFREGKALIIRQSADGHDQLAAILNKMRAQVQVLRAQDASVQPVRLVDQPPVPQPPADLPTPIIPSFDLVPASPPMPQPPPDVPVTFAPQRGRVLHVNYEIVLLPLDPALFPVQPDVPTDEPLPFCNPLIDQISFVEPLMRFPEGVHTFVAPTLGTSEPCDCGLWSRVSGWIRNGCCTNGNCPAGGREEESSIIGGRGQTDR